MVLSGVKLHISLIVLEYESPLACFGGHRRSAVVKRRKEIASSYFQNSFYMIEGTFL